jgi:hypothetical protein
LSNDCVVLRKAIKGTYYCNIALGNEFRGKDKHNADIDGRGWCNEYRREASFVQLDDGHLEFLEEPEFVGG